MEIKTKRQTHILHPPRPPQMDVNAASRLESVDLLYLHAPDHETPLEETLRAVHEVRRWVRYIGPEQYVGRMLSPTLASDHAFMQLCTAGRC